MGIGNINKKNFLWESLSALGRTRICNHLLRKQVLCPIELPGRLFRGSKYTPFEGNRQEKTRGKDTRTEACIEIFWSSAWKKDWTKYFQLLTCQPDKTDCIMQTLIHLLPTKNDDIHRVVKKGVCEESGYFPALNV